MIRLVLSLLVGAAVSQSVAAAPRTIYVMRHLERDAGRDPDLNAVGAANAQRLAGWFRRERPRAIYVTPYRRAQQTVAPLAKALGIEPVEYDPNAPEKMLATARAGKGPVLIVGHSNTVPKLVQALGGPRWERDLADTDYGRIWVLRRGRLTVAELSAAQP